MADELQPVPQSATGEVPVPNPIEASVQLAQEGRYLDAFTNWFQAPVEQRSAAIKNAVVWFVNYNNYLDAALKDPSISSVDAFVLNNFSLLHSITGEKIFTPSKETLIHTRELDSFRYPAMGGRGKRRFVRNPGSAIRPVGEEEQPNETVDTTSGLEQSIPFAQYGLSNKGIDKFSFFPSPQSRIKESLIDDEVATLIKRILPHLENTHVDDEETGFFLGRNLLHGVKHLNIVTDPEIGKYFEAWEIVDIRNDNFANMFQEKVVNAVMQFYFPSAAYFEKVFAQNNSYTQEGYQFKTQQGKLPGEVLYFTLLRQLVHLDKFVGKADLSAKEAERMKERIVGYLFSDPFMQRVRNYLRTDIAYPDDLLSMGIEGMNMVGDNNYRPRFDIEFDLKVQQRGEPARVKKRERFGEVVRAADKFLREKGDAGKADELAAREVNGTRFADYLKAA